MIEVTPGAEIVDALPALYIRKHKALVVADAHLGYEEEAARHGVFMPRFQLARFLNVLEQALDLVDADRVIIAGDLKHRFDGLGRLERKEVTRAINFIKERVRDVIVVRGNHDNYLPILKDRLGFEIVEHLILGEYVIIHGHKPLPSEARGKIVIMGHEHPSIAIRDSIGTVGKFPCFLRGILKDSKTRVVVLPAIGAYQTGSKVTLNPSTYLSPVLREEVVLEELEPIIVDEEIGVLELPRLADMLDFM